MNSSEMVRQLEDLSGADTANAAFLREVAAMIKSLYGRVTRLDSEVTDLKIRLFDTQEELSVEVVRSEKRFKEIGRLQQVVKAKNAELAARKVPHVCPSCEHVDTGE